jgi:hypothetical protein
MTALQDASQLQLDRLRRAWRGSVLPGFLRWWGGELSALLPVRWRQAFAGGERWYVLERGDDVWQLRRAGGCDKESSCRTLWRVSPLACRCVPDRRFPKYYRKLRSRS